MSRNRLGGRRILRFKPRHVVSGPRLPAVDIFSDKTPPLISSLSDLNFDCTNSFLTSTRNAPILGNHVTFQPGFIFQPSSFDNWSVWIWANVVTFNSSIDVSSSPGDAAFGTGCGPANVFGGNGGSGGSGGGGGSVSNFTSDSGGSGGSGVDGQPGITDTGGCGGCGSSAGAGGEGSALGRASYIVGCPYVVPFGGNGAGTGGCGGGAPGVGGAGYGGGGAGGAVSTSPFNLVGGGGGGGGGGFIGIVANQVIGASTLFATGAPGGSGLGCGGGTGGPGGGGSIYMAAKQYAGTLSFSVASGGGGCCCTGATAGNFRLGEINHAGTAVTVYHENTNASWNNS